MHSFKTKAVAVLAVALGYCQQTVGDEKLADRIEHKIALQSAVAAVDQIVEQLGSKASPARIDSLADFISANPSQHQSPDTSKRLSADQVDRLLRQDFASSKQLVLQRANIGLKTPVTPGELQAKLGNIDRAVDVAVDKFIDTEFDTLYSTARTRAVARQRGKLEVNIDAPSQSEVDAALTRDPRWETHEDAFAHQLRMRALPRDIVLFDENADAIDAEVDRVLAGVGKHIDFQFQTARTATSDDTVPVSCIVSDSIKAHAEQHLAKAVEEFSGGGKGRYDVFDVVSRLIADEAIDLERHRLQDFIAHVDLPISPGSLRAHIEANTAHHRERAESQRIFESSCLGPVREYVVAAYVGQGNLSSGDAAKTRIASIIQQNGHSTALQGRVKSAVAAELQKVRSAMAGDQVQQSFPKLDKWRPSDESVARIFDTGELPLSFAECVGLAELDAGDQVLLEEAEAAVVEAVRRQFESAISALRSQLLILKDLEQSQESKLTVDVAAGVPKEDIVREWTALLEKKWSPNGASSSRFTLFARTQKEVEKAVSKHFNAVQERIRQRLADRQVSGASSNSASSGTRLQQVAKLPRPTTSQDAQDSTAATASSTTSDRSGGGGSGGGSPGAGGGSGGSGGAPGGSGNGQGTGERNGQNRERAPGVDGDGPAPDCAILLEDRRADACVAKVMFPNTELSPSSPSPTYDFDPSDIVESSSQIVHVFWPTIESYLGQKLRSVSMRSKDDQPFELRLHVVVGTDAVRHRMSLLIRAGMEERFALWARANLDTGDDAAFHWSDSGQ